MRRGYVDTSLGQIHYRTLGEGKPVLLLHQTPASSVEFEFVMPILAEKYRTIAIDTIGYGSSDAPPRELAIEDYARNVVEVMESLGIPKAHVVGHHTGAVVAIELAASFPERVDRLVLSADTGRAERAQVSKEWLTDNPNFRYDGIDDGGEFLTRKWQVYRSFCLPGADPRVWYPVFLAALSTGPRIHDGHKAGLLYDLNSRLPLIKSDTLAIVGTNDQFGSDLDYTKKMIPRCETKAIDGGGVFMPREMPGAFAAAVLGFLD